MNEPRYFQVSTWCSQTDKKLRSTSSGYTVGGCLPARRKRARPSSRLARLRAMQPAKRLGADLHVMATVGDLPSTTIATARQICRDADLELLVLARNDLRPGSGHAAPSNV
jgi:hypothetical protein